MEMNRIRNSFEIISNTKFKTHNDLPLFDYFSLNTLISDSYILNESQLNSDPFIYNLKNHAEEAYNFTSTGFLDVVLFYLNFFFEQADQLEGDNIEAFDFLLSTFSEPETEDIMRNMRIHYHRSSIDYERYLAKKIFFLIKKYFYLSIGVTLIKMGNSQYFKKIHFLRKKKYILDYNKKIIYYPKFNGFHASYEKYLNNKGMPSCCILCYTKVRNRKNGMEFEDIKPYIPIKIMNKYDNKKECYLNLQFTALMRTGLICTTCFSFSNILIKLKAIEKYKYLKTGFCEIKKWNLKEFYDNKTKNYIILQACLLNKIIKKNNRKIKKSLVKCILQYLDFEIPKEEINYFIKKNYEQTDYYI